MTPSRPEAPGGPAPRVDQRAGAAPTAPHDGAAPADAEFHDRGLWTIPNLISLLRLLAVPWFLWLLLHDDRPIAAGILLAILGATDWIEDRQDPRPGRGPRPAHRGGASPARRRQRAPVGADRRARP